MNGDDTIARSIHDLGLATWFGGSLMGAVGLNGASAAVQKPKDRIRVSNAGWARWTPVNLAAIGAYVVGGAALTWSNRDRLRAQQGVGQVSLVKTGVSALALAATAYSRYLGQKIMDAEEVRAQDAVTPNEETPPEVAKAQRQLKVLQWAIPAHVGALIIISSKMGEQQKPQSMVAGLARRLRPNAA